MGRRSDLSIGRRSAATPDPDEDREAREAGLGARLQATRRGRGRGAARRKSAADQLASSSGRAVPAAERAEAPRPTGRFWVPGTDGPGTMVLLPDARQGVLARGLRWIVLAGCFFAGAAGATAAFPWVRTALDVALDEVRSVAEAGLLHSPDRTAAGTAPTGAERP